MRCAYPPYKTPLVLGRIRQAIVRYRTDTTLSCGYTVMVSFDRGASPDQASAERSEVGLAYHFSECCDDRMNNPPCAPEVNAGIGVPVRFPRALIAQGTLALGLFILIALLPSTLPIAPHQARQRASLHPRQPPLRDAVRLCPWRMPSSSPNTGVSRCGFNWVSAHGRPEPASRPTRTSTAWSRRSSTNAMLRSSRARPSTVTPGSP